ncbi:MAG: tRNA (guanosine(46)-N7)-methyltransferase TrmB [Chromatiaceae bacterium]|nr:tRNA (guanosine(46)-N7)-methyltransferase TrmB [Chromatiaceae bacterium]
MKEPDCSRRPIRSFVLREGRITRAQARAIEVLWPRFGVDWNPGVPLDLSVLFGNPNPVYLEIGFGNGDVLAELASCNPRRNYLGIEVHRPGVGHLLLEIERRGLENAKVCCHDAVEILALGLARASLAGVYLLFPDPWPKQRHHKRRIFKPELVRLLARVIRPGGLLHIATDWEPYARQILELLTCAGDLFENTASPRAFASLPQERPQTRFEQRGVRLGHQVRDLIYRRRGS